MAGMVMDASNQSLARLLKYKNQAVFDRYTQHYTNNQMPAEEAFCELVKYLWLCNHHKQEQLDTQDSALNFSCVMHAEMRELDDMWHTFLLFTRDYHDFCLQFFGEFFHHQPLSNEEKNLPLDQYQVELKKYLTYIYDKLGAVTLTKWFGECC